MDDKQIDVCIIEHDPTARTELLEHLLSEQFSAVEAQDGQEGLAQIRNHQPRVVIAALDAPVVGGLEICREVRSDPSLDGTYLIVVSPEPSRQTRHDVLNSGADDILSKPYDYEELLARLRNGLRFSTLQERLRKAALTDGLTSLCNHVHFRNLLDSEFSRTRRYGGLVSLVMFDLDHFKAVNDTYGHEVGNRVLKETARYLEHMVRDADIVARYGGEEFVIICPQTNLDEAEHLAERIRQRLPEDVRIPEHPQLQVTATLGVVCSTDVNVHSVTELINLADQALYLGKSQGRNQVARSDQIDEQTVSVGVQIAEIDRLRKQVLALNMQAKELCLQSVWSLVQALEARDRYTARQSRNVTAYIMRLTEAAGWPETLRVATANAAMLHNLGKIGVPDHILQKPDTLTAREAALLRQVPLMTCKILDPLRIFETETLIVRHLRERFDGSGHPDGLKGTSIPLGSRLLAIAEAFDAMTSDRAYRRRRSLDSAVAEIQRLAGQQFDPEFASLLERVISEQRADWETRIKETLAADNPAKELTAKR
ncbi:MAG: diguanylate cyclase [Planctomycetota bacterium]